jgi:hypothetical protein
MRRQCARCDTGRLFKTFGRLAGQCSSLHSKTLTLPGITRSRKHRGLASTGKTDYRRNLRLPGDMLNGNALFLT